MNEAANTQMIPLNIFVFCCLERFDYLIGTVDFFTDFGTGVTSVLIADTVGSGVRVREYGSC